jgi:CO/xanthine dehydrogenase Mo-binding subunit
MGLRDRTIRPPCPDEPGGSKYIGARIARREDARFLIGCMRYVDDIRLPRTVHAAFGRSPYTHAEIRTIRTDHAAGQEGMVGILTGSDVHASSGYRRHLAKILVERALTQAWQRLD